MGFMGPHRALGLVRIRGYRVTRGSVPGPSDTLKEYSADAATDPPLLVSSEKGSSRSLRYKCAVLGYFSGPCMDMGRPVIRNDLQGKSAHYGDKGRIRTLW